MLTTVVVGHRARAAAAVTLAHSLHARLFLDEGDHGEWENHRRAIEWAAQQGRSHVLVLQDDAVPADRLLDHAQRAAEQRPDQLIGLYVGRSRPASARVEAAVAQADEHGASWIESQHLYWGVGVIIPADRVPALLAYCDTRDDAYDVRLGKAWVKVTRRPVAYTWPSLVDHADGPSILDEADGRTTPRDPGRVAHRVGAPTWTDVAAVQLR